MSPALKLAIDRATRKIAPLWPLQHFVAVNPFLGFTDHSFGSTCALLRRVARINMLMPRSFYREALQSGYISEQDLRVAGAADSDVLRRAAQRDPAAAARPDAVVATVAEVLDRLHAGDRQASRTAFMVDEISRWCAAYFDAGQASWRLPGLELRPYAAWRAAMRHDRNAETMGIRGFRRAVAELPDDVNAAIETVVAQLGIPERAIEDYLHRALFDIGGWAAYARYLAWDNALYGRTDDTLVQLLAIRLAWGYALFRERRDEAFQHAWAAAMQAAAMSPLDSETGTDPELAIDLALQDAYEAAYQRRLLQTLRTPPPDTALAPTPEAAPSATRPAFQAAFCIDVRSEVFRRALESVCPRAQTLGFAGFFGFPIEYVPIGRVRGGAQCPVLLKPTFIVCEAVRHADDEQETEILGLRLLRRRAAKAWKSFKLSAVSSFTYVETAGLSFAGKLASDSLGLTRTVHDPNTDGLDAEVLRRIGPRIAPRSVQGRQTGFDPAQRLQQAEAVLRAMSMTGDFARLVVLAGHGSTTVNNPHASGLDCGACGGHTGEANARVAAAILNDATVRSGLRERGIDIPQDSWFLAALHDTTTDRVQLFDLEDLPASHANDVRELQRALQQAGAHARRERAPLLGIEIGPELDAEVLARSRDWAQTRPEWGLAGNAAFIAAPRARTQGRDLDGRAFLHSYAWRSDADFKVLELIMTAPMVVASWINLQYYGSSVNNKAFGSGNKVLHNVTGTFGVLEGNAGDLKTGLPWQSVHDGRRLMHEPIRLHVLIEAPLAAINSVIARHENVRQLTDNRWLHLFAIDDSGRIRHRYVGKQRWEALN